MWRFFIPRGRRAFKIPGDVKMYIDLSEPWERGYPFDVIEPKITKIFLESIEQGDTIIDVGSSIGRYA